MLRNRKLGGGRLDLEAGLRVAAVLFGHVGFVLQGGFLELRFDLPRRRFHRAVDASGEPILAPPAAARRSTAGDLDLRRVRERRDLIADVSGREPRCGFGFLHRLFSVGDAVTGGDPRERLRALVAGYLDEFRLRGKLPEEPDEPGFVLGEFVGVVGRDDRRSFPLDPPSELSVGDDIAFDRLPVVGDHRIGGSITPNVAALYVDAENEIVQGARSRTHSRRYDACGHKSRDGGWTRPSIKRGRYDGSRRLERRRDGGTGI